MNRRLGHDTATVTAFTLVSRITGFGRVLAVAAVLGSGLLGDVYQTANLVPNLLFELVAAGVLQAVLVPAFVAARREGGDTELTAAVRATSGVVFVALLGVAALGMLLAPFLARLMIVAEPSTAVAAEKLDVMVPMVLVFVPQLLFYGLAMATSAALHAKGRFVAAAVAPAVNNIVVIVACLLFRAHRGGQVSDLDLTPTSFAIIAVGTTLGVVAYGLTTAFALKWRGIGWWPTWNPAHAAVRSMRRHFGWATLSIVGTLVPTAMALALGNGAAGGVAVFVYAFAFYALPHALVSVPVATTVSPRVAERWQAGDPVGARDAVDSAIGIAVPLLVLAGAGMVALAWPVARVAAFGQTASQGLAPIAHALIAFGPGLLGYGVAFVLTRVLFSIGEVRRASLLMIAGAIAGSTVMIVASAVMPADDRAAALAVGYGVAQLITAVLLGRRVHGLLGALRPARLARWLGEAALGGVLAVLAMDEVVSWFAVNRRASAMAVLVAGTIGVAVFGLVVGALRGARLHRFGLRPARGDGRLGDGGLLGQTPAVAELEQ